MLTEKLIKIMLADDDPDDRELFEQAFIGLPAEVSTVPNGTELIKVLRSGRELPDYIFLDLNMPEQNGKDCLREIRSMDLDVKVIIYSTSSNVRDIDETFSLGADLYVRKPNTFTALLHTVASLLELEWDEESPREREAFVFNAS